MPELYYVCEQCGHTVSSPRWPDDCEGCGCRWDSLSRFATLAEAELGSVAALAPLEVESEPAA